MAAEAAGFAAFADEIRADGFAHVADIMVGSFYDPDLEQGCAFEELISFHGGLDSPTPAEGKNIKAKVLALHGADDPFVPAKDVAAFEAEMKTAGVD